MNKVAIITDTHFGVRGESSVWLAAHEKMLKEFFDDVVDNNINTIWMLGDIVDSRKSISSKLIKWIYTNWTKPIIDNGLKVELIIGNHDTYYRSTNTPNLPFELFSGVNEINVYVDDPVEIKGPNNTSVLMVPWLSPENMTKFDLAMKKKYDVVCGHFDIVGCLMQGGQVSEHGLSPDTFKKHGRVFSGHYHKKSTYNNIEYLGNPVATNWGESVDPHGWHFWDGKDLTFRQFEYKLYDRIHVNHENKIEYEWNGAKFIKIYVKKRNEFFLNQLINSIRDNNEVLQLQIVDESDEAIADNISFDVEELKDDLLTLMLRTVDESQYEDPSSMKLLLSELHQSIQTSKLIA